MLEPDKTTVLLESIKSALQMKIAKSGLESVPLESEQKLAVRFSVARQTIHKVILGLLEDGWLLRKDKKYTLYTNPDHATPELKNVGIIRGGLSKFSTMSNSLMSGIFSGFSGHHVFIHSIRFSSMSPDEKCLELRNAELDGLIVLKGYDTDYPRITERILEMGIPVVFVYETYWSSLINTPESVSSVFDRIGCLKRIAAQVKRLGYGNVFMVSSGIDALELFNSISGNMVKREYFNMDMHSLAEQYSSIMKKDSPDLVICDGPTPRYRFLLDALNRFSGKTPPALMIHKFAREIDPELEKKYRVHFLDDFEKEFERGFDVANRLLEKMRQER